MRKHRFHTRIILGVLFFTGLAFLFGLLVQTLWNALMPEIFGLSAITYWQSIGLLLLAHILFHGRHGGHFSSHWRNYHWRERFAEKVAEMSPEERDRFRHEWEDKCWFHERHKTQDAEK